MRFLTLHRALWLLKASVALVFILHAVVRILNNTIPRFGSFLEQKQLPYGVVIVWVITVFELVGGVLLIIGYRTKLLATGFIFLLLVGIVLIHFSRGWFVGEHGVGGVEYSFILIFALTTLIAADNEAAYHPAKQPAQ